MSARKSTMAKLPSERIVNPLDIIREKSKYASKTEVLEEIYKNYYYDSKVCFNMATNKATSKEIRCKLAKHEHAEIRLEIAKKSEFIDDENVLKKLALDDYEIRKQVARSTKSDSIKELLYKSNPHHLDIRIICIKRLKDMNVVEKLIFSKAPEKTISTYLDSLLFNPNISVRILLLVLKYAEKLSNEQIDLIIEHIKNDEKSVTEILDSITEE